MNLTVNGESRKIDTEPGLRLLDVLRDELGLGGLKEGCGIGICGTCTVLMDGQPISSCLMMAGQAEGHDIVTVEGLERDGELHPVQQAFLDHAAFQCAYCTPGFVLASIALLKEHPSPSDSEIREYLGGNLCRCGSYVNIVKAVLSMAASTNSTDSKKLPGA